MGAYLFTLGSFKVYQGKFSQARELLDDFVFLEEKYGYGPIAPKYMIHTELLIVSRLLFEAQNMANDLISFSVKMGQIDDFPGYGWRAVAQVLMKDITGARDSLEQAEQMPAQTVFLDSLVSVQQPARTIPARSAPAGRCDRWWFPVTDFKTGKGRTQERKTGRKKRRQVCPSIAPRTIA